MFYICIPHEKCNIPGADFYWKVDNPKYKSNRQHVTNGIRPCIWLYGYVFIFLLTLSMISPFFATENLEKT